MLGLRARLRALLQRSVSDAELDEELQYHLDREVERNVGLGMSVRQARNTARRSLGNLTLHAESARDAYGWTWLEQLGRDVIYGWRSLRRSPVFTLVATLSLALGIGANTMIFGVAYSVLFEPLSVTNPEQLVSLARVAGNDGPNRRFSAADVDRLRGSHSVAGPSAMDDADNTPVIIHGQRKFVTLDLVSGSFYATIGLRPLRGRIIDTSDVASSAPVAFVSQSFAEREFGSPERALGQVIRVRDLSVSIVGVAPASYRGIDYPGWFTIAVPMSLASTVTTPDERRGEEPVFAVARLAPGVTRRQAEAELDATFQRCCVHPRVERLTLTGMTSGVAGGKDDAREDYAPLLYILMVGAGIVLLIACANVGNLLLVRASVREREIAVRMSLGASRGRIVRQLITESLLLGILGGLVALPFAAWGTLGVQRLIPNQMSVYADIVRWHYKPVLLVFTAAVAMACVTLAALVPAIRATRAGLSASLKIGGRGSVGNARRLLDRGVVVAQLALALSLVSAASLLVSTLRNVARADGGFSTSGVTIVSIETRGTPYERAGIVPIQDEILRRVRAIPGVERAGMATNAPIAGGRNRTVKLDADGQVSMESIELVGVTPDYLGAIGIAIVAGRDFTTRDDSTSERVAIISEAVSRRGFAGRNPIGAMIRIGSDSSRMVRVIGVARDTKMFGLRGDRVPAVYAPVTQTGEWPFLGLAVRMPDGSESLTRRITNAIDNAAPGVWVRRVSSMRSDVRESMFAERLAASIAALFGALALVLAAVGIYGVVAFNVSRRTNEIGVRMALGAQRRDILALVARGSLGLVAAAVLIGGPLAFAAGRGLRSQLYGVSAHDPSLLVLTLGVLVVVALIATVAPARRAARIDPMVALRSD